MKKGFTLIELLVVIAIIALLSTLSVVALNSARTKSRDSRRLSDIKQIRTALDLYFDGAQLYPTTTGNLGSASFSCLTSNGWTTTAGCSSGTVYMQKVPTDPTTGKNYAYTSTGSGAGYTIVYQIESPSTTATATPDTIGYNQ